MGFYIPLFFFLLAQGAFEMPYVHI
jgi:hypothetical protein